VISTAILSLGKTLADERMMVTAVFAAVFAALLSAVSADIVRPQAAVVILGFLIASELGLIFGQNWGNWNDPNHTGYLRSVPQAQEAVQFLHTRIQPLRVDVDDKVFGFNLGDYYGVETLGGYLASLTSNLVGMETHGPRTQQLFAVNYHIGKEQRFAEDVLLYEGKNGVKVYEYPVSLPRVRTVHQVKELPTRKNFNDFIADPSNDLRQVAAFVGKPPDVESCPPENDAVRLVRHNAGDVQIDATLKCRGVVILADTYFPGWKATVDGKPAKIWEPYGVLRGVVVDSGSHTIQMTYLPGSVLAGAGLTGSAFLLALTLGLRRRNGDG